MSRFARQVDANQVEVVACLRALGAQVAHTHTVGAGFPDLVVHFKGTVYLMEVKDGWKVPSARKLTPAELAFAASMPVFLVECAEDAAEVLRGMREPIKGVPLALQKRGGR